MIENYCKPLMVRKLSALIFLAITLSSLPLYAAEFTADSHVERGGQVKESVFYFAKGKWRMNENTPQGRRATIFRKDTRTLTVLWPDKKLYFVQSVPEQQAQMLLKLKPGIELERKKLGHEIMSGFKTTKYRVTYLLQGQQFNEIEWYSEELDAVVKTRAEDNSHMAHLTNIRKIKLNKTIFEVPSDYRRARQSDLAALSSQSPQ